MLPRWAYGYVQSKERYKTQDELVATVKEFRDRKIPLDVIVQDWSYWISSQWGGDIDTARYPDIAKMIRDIHEQNARVIISIWPNPSDRSTAGKALKDAGCRLHAGRHALHRLLPSRGAQTLLGNRRVEALWPARHGRLVVRLDRTRER
jgi:alpha-glucosidase (family GH31 glycosyl hydrolase)